MKIFSQKTWMLLGWLLLISILKISAQPAGFLEHFTDENGLHQSPILKIIQDKKGFIWLASYDGLIRFDGYEFKNFKVRPKEPFKIKSNRINNLLEDNYGRVWIKSNENEAYCYDPARDRFWSLQMAEVFHDKSFALSRMKLMPSGRVWLMSEEEGVICIADSSYKTYLYNKQNKLLKGNSVLDIYEDKGGNTWLFTETGLELIPQNGLGAACQNYELRNIKWNEPQTFRCVVELENEIWFGGTHGQIWKYAKTGKVFYNLDLQVPSTIFHLSWLNQDELLIVTINWGFFTYNIKSNELRSFNSEIVKGLSTDNLKLLLVNAPKEIWFINKQPGIFKFNFETEKLTGFKTGQEENYFGNIQPAAFVLKDKNGNLWIQPKGKGLHFYDRKENKLQALSQELRTPESVLPDVVNTACIDKQNNLWFSSRNYGLQKFTVFNQQFDQFQVVQSDSSFVANNVRSIAEDKDGNIWIATKEESRLTVYDKHKRRIGYLTSHGSLGSKSESLWKNAIYCILHDQQNNIWLGTRGDGIYKFIPKGKDFSYQVQHFKSQPSNPFSLSDDDVYCMLQDAQGYIWIGTWGGGLNRIEQDGQEIRFLNYRNKFKGYPIKTYSWIRCLAESKNGILYAGTTNGLLFLKVVDRPTDEILYNEYSNFPNHDILSMLISGEQELYLATYGGRIYRETGKDQNGFPKQFENFLPYLTHSEGRITAMLQDDEDKLWICSERNLVRFSPETDHFETFPEVKRIIGDHIFLESSACKLNDGEIMFGFSNGVFQLNPQNIVSSEFVPYLALTEFQLLNNSSEESEDLSSWNTIDDADKIELKHNQNFFKIQFAALDFNGKKNVQYRYKLDGLEDNWNYTSKERTATYTNISKGEYLLRVSSTNGNGVWVPNERQLRIVVKPSLWETKFAYMLYFLLLATLFIVIQKTILTIFRLRHNVAMQQKLADMKLRFFTDISHEIRTPLTMITAPVEHLVHDQSTPEPIKKQLSIVEQSTGRLLKLVNQILDLRKFQDRRLTIEEIDLNVFTSNICREFGEVSRREKISLHFSVPKSAVRIWADREYLDKMIVNLLSNAFKYCPGGSEIQVKVQATEKQGILKVMDNGPGISKEKQKKLFIRFSSFNEDPSKPSTGIGLSLVKDIADRHFAKVQVESEPGKGTNFTVSFQKGRDHFGSDVDVVLPGASVEAEEMETGAAETKETGIGGTPLLQGKQTGLLVEDDEDLRRFMKSILEEEFMVYEAKDGEQGYELAHSLTPDFIISDIMMPKRDGIELLQCLRNDFATSHIPIILLTAKTDIESKLQGLSHGADDYLTKPFSVSYFKARIINLLEQRRRLQEFYKQPVRKPREPVISNDPLPLSARDQLFMTDVINCIHENIDNPDFSVEVLGKQMGLSKTAFFNKLKSLTGLSPVEYIREIRLNHAAKILTEENLLVKEACFLSGFADLKYFGKCFKAKFNMTPLEYLKKFGQQTK
ncbi:MAG: two-component regulator propeller domain-containing protein [Mangrovibacterium sp.]